MWTVFDSDALPVGERFAAWEAAMERSLALFRIATPDPERFEGRLSMAPMGALALSDIAYTSLEVRRTPRLIQQADPELVQLALIVSGRQHIEQTGRTTALTAGGMVLYDTSRPFRAHAEGGPHPSRSLLLHIPRRALPLRPAELTALTAVPLEADRGVGRLLADLLRGLVTERQACTPTDADRLAGTALDLATTVLMNHLGEPHAAQTTDRVLFLRSVTFIRERLADATLTPDTVAAALNVSRRQLYRVHQRQGTTVAAFIRQQRLDRCCRDLTDPRLDHLTIGTIAVRWGFTRHSEFTRVFRRVLGMPPSDYRATARHRHRTADRPPGTDSARAGTSG